MAYEAISLIGIGAAFVCAYISSLFRDDWFGQANKSLLIIFAFLFILSSFDTGLMIAHVQNETTGYDEGTVAEHMGVGVGVMSYLLYPYLAFQLIYLIYSMVTTMGTKRT